LESLVKLKTFYSTQVKVRLHLWPTVAYYCTSEYLLQFLMKLSCKALHGKGAQHDRNLNPHNKKTLNFHTSLVTSP